MNDQDDIQPCKDRLSFFFKNMPRNSRTSRFLHNLLTCPYLLLLHMLMQLVKATLSWTTNPCWAITESAPQWEKCHFCQLPLTPLPTKFVHVPSDNEKWKKHLYFCQLEMYWVILFSCFLRLCSSLPLFDSLATHLELFVDTGLSAISN